MVGKCIHQVRRKLRWQCDGRQWSTRLAVVAFISCQQAGTAAGSLWQELSEPSGGGPRGRWLQSVPEPSYSTDNSEQSSNHVRFNVQLDGAASLSSAGGGSSSSADSFTIEVHPDWAPLGAERFFELISIDFFDEARFFRVVPGFMVQFGLPADPQVAAQWRSRTIEDDPPGIISNTRGTVSFATSGPNSRTTQIFINYENNSFLDDQGFTPFGKVDETGMQIVERIYSGYREDPKQNRIQTEGNQYLNDNFPMLSYITSTVGAPHNDDSWISEVWVVMVAIAALLECSFRGPTLAMVMVFKCASRAPKDTELARAKRQVPVHDRDGEANEGTGLLGERDGSDELVWDPDYRTTGAKVIPALSGASSSTSSRQVLAAGVM